MLSEARNTKMLESMRVQEELGIEEVGDASYIPPTASGYAWVTFFEAMSRRQPREGPYSASNKELEDAMGGGVGLC
jgi:hypothetical protein